MLGGAGMLWWHSQTHNCGFATTISCRMHATALQGKRFVLWRLRTTISAPRLVSKNKLTMSKVLLRSSFSSTQRNLVPKLQLKGMLSILSTRQSLFTLVFQYLRTHHAGSDISTAVYLSNLWVMIQIASESGYFGTTRYHSECVRIWYYHSLSEGGLAWQKPAKQGLTFTASWESSCLSSHQAIQHGQQLSVQVAGQNHVEVNLCHLYSETYSGPTKYAVVIVHLQLDDKGHMYLLHCSVLELVLLFNCFLG